MKPPPAPPKNQTRPGGRDASESYTVFTSERPRRRSYTKIGLYEPETNVVPHAKIDLDQQEINAAVAAVDFAEAIRVYEEGGGGTCTEADVADEAVNQCNAVGDPKGNSVKGSGAIRTIEGFATSGPSKMMEEKWYLIYKDYWGDEKYCDTFVRNAYASTTMEDLMKGELIKKGTAYQCCLLYTSPSPRDA